MDDFIQWPLECWWILGIWGFNPMIIGILGEAIAHCRAMSASFFGVGTGESPAFTGLDRIWNHWRTLRHRDESLWDSGHFFLLVTACGTPAALTWSPKKWEVGCRTNGLVEVSFPVLPTNEGILGLKLMGPNLNYDISWWDFTTIGRAKLWILMKSFFLVKTIQNLLIITIFGE